MCKITNNEEQTPLQIDDAIMATSSFAGRPYANVTRTQSLEIVVLARMPRL